jgi:hypothetical protein
VNISLISSNSNISRTTINNNNEIKMLEKQKEQLQDQIKRINESDMDNKTKQENVKLLEDQIQQIETEIQQKRSEKLSQTTKKNKSEQSDSNASAGKNSTDSYRADLMQADFTASKAEILNDTKDRLKGRDNILKQEIELDEGRGVDPKAKKEELQKSEASSRKLDKELGETLRSSKNETDKTTETKDKNNDTDNKEKSEEKNRKIDILI